jgi:hypothetical protein
MNVQFGKKKLGKCYSLTETLSQHQPKATEKNNKNPSDRHYSEELKTQHF